MRISDWSSDVCSSDLPGLQAIEGVEVASVCNRTEESGRRVAEQFGIARVVTDPGDVIHDPDLDAVCIGTWPYRHAEYAVAVLEARSAERRVGKECVSTCRYRGSPDH